MAQTKICDDSAAYRLLYGVIVQARRDLTRKTTRVRAQESALEFWGIVAEAKFNVNRPQPDITRGPALGAVSGADVRARRKDVRRNTGTHRATPTTGGNGDTV